MTAAFATEPTIDYGHVELLPVHFDDLDPLGMVHNARYALLVERALATFWRQHGHTFRDGRPTTPDAFNVVKEFSIGYRAPIRGISEVRVHLWLEHLGSSCAVYGYRLLSTDGATVYADGRRVAVKLDPETLRPSPWTPEARAVAEGLLRRPVHAQPVDGPAALLGDPPETSAVPFLPRPAECVRWLALRWAAVDVLLVSTDRATRGNRPTPWVGRVLSIIGGNSEHAYGVLDEEVTRHALPLPVRPHLAAQKLASTPNAGRIGSLAVI